MSTSHAITVGDPIVVTNAAAYGNLSGPDLLQVLVSSSTAGTLTITDSPPAGTRTLLNAMPLVAGQWYPLGIRCVGATTITVGGTATILLTYKKD